MDVLVYASLLKKIRGVASGIADIEYNHDTSTLDFICVDGTVIKVPLDGTSLTQEQIIATVSCGAVSAGDVIPANTDITALTKRLLVKDLAPSVTITSTKSNTIVYEKGVSISPTFTVEVNKIQSFDADIKNVTFSSNPTDANFNMVDNTPNATTNTYTKTTTISDTVEYTVKATNTGDKVGNKKYKYTFVNPTWYGVLPETFNATTVTENDIKGIGTKELKDIASIKTSGWTVNFTADMEKIFIAYDASYGNLTSIKDVTNGFELISGFENVTIPIVTADGSTVNYKFYIASTRGRYNDMPVLFKW